MTMLQWLGRGAAERPGKPYSDTQQTTSRDKTAVRHYNVAPSAPATWPIRGRADRRGIAPVAQVRPP